MKKLIIMRGLSGAGKTTKALSLIKEVPGSVLCSADSFMINALGEYVFEAHLLPQAHEACRLHVAHAMICEAPQIIVDNTNTQRWEYQPYLNLALRHGYSVEFETVGNLTDIDIYAARNVHGVSKDIIKKQAQRFES